MADWYRKKSWTEDDEKDFFFRFSRARKHGQAQYLRVQAIELIETKDKKLLSIAESLINKLFAEFPEDKTNKSIALDSLGHIYKFRGDENKALEYYKQAVDFEKEFPYALTQAYLDYSELVIKLNKTSLFSSVQQMILERESMLLFPIEKYKVYSILAIINKQKGETHLVKYYTELAEKFATAETSGLRYHKSLGVVKERDSWLDRLLKR